MRSNRIALAVALLFPVLVAAQEALSVATLKISEPKKLGELDADKLKGQPSRLSWSPDGQQLYLQVMEGEFGQPPKRLGHFIINSENGSRKDEDSEPEWASVYWSQKSAQASPDDASLKIELKEDTRTEKTVNTPMGGALARGGSGDSTGGVTGDALANQFNQQTIRIITTSLKGTTIGVFEGMPLVPGRTFGWAHKGSKAIVFADPKSGKVTVMDANGERREINGSKDALLPAWSPDGSRIAWLQKDGKKKYVLQTARVSTGS